ncbi:MAG: sel1 repeat family protein [Gammaproteobacteria bacterium]|nr:sel1 repeat family protein [Gammaproteobacteria bacterium]
MMNFNDKGQRAMVLVLQAVLFIGLGVFAAVLVQQRHLADPKVRLDIAHQALLDGNDRTAFALFSGLADAGNARAQYWLGDMYERGYGVKKDMKKAIDWLKKAAVQGLATAQARLGELYLDGQQAPQDFTAARSWLEKAANQHQASAERLLGDMARNGLGMPRDPVRAYQLYEQAILDGDEYAVHLRDRVLEKMSPEQLAQAQAATRPSTTDSAPASR